MLRKFAAILALTLPIPAVANAQDDAPLQTEQALTLFGENAANGLQHEVEAQSHIDQILSDLRQVRLAGIDQYADQDIKDAIAAAVDGLPNSSDFLTKRDNAALVAFYQERSFAPAWFENGEWTKAARKLIFALSRADLDGLNPAKYETPSLGLSRAKDATAQDIAKAEIALSLALTQYTREAYAGQVDPRIFSKKVMTIKPHYPDSINALNKLVMAQDPVAEMRSYNPQHKGFIALRDEYNHQRALSRSEEVVTIPEGKSMRVGMSDDRVPLLRKKFGLEAPESEEAKILFDEELEAKVKGFQKDHGLIADGIAGKATLSVLNEDRKDLIADILANLERWRWLPRDLGDFHVMVNIPTFSLQVVEHGKEIHQTRVVVGKTSNKTPIFSDEMEYVVVNPYWNVPASIATKELLPKIKQDPSSFFASSTYQVLASVKGRTQVVDPSQLDWSRVEPDMVRIRQTPGTRNALGNVKFMFPNQHAVYLHDTPSKSLFNQDYRAFSHGCVRVYEPFKFADVILKQTEKWDAERIKSILGETERRVNLDKKIPVHLVYFTTWMAENGTLQLRSDIYGHNAVVKKALNL